MTLVLVDSGARVQSLWALMDVESVEAAARALQKRERTEEQYIDKWKRGQRSPDLIPELAEWAEGEELDGVVWTALPPKFCGTNGRIPTEEEVATYLGALTGCKRNRAKEYIEKAPRQIVTEYRRRIEEVLGCSPIESGSG